MRARRGAGSLRYVEEFTQPGVRHCKLWFEGRFLGGRLSTASDAATQEHIVGAAWMLPTEFADKTVFPPMLVSDYWKARDAVEIRAAEYMGLREMASF